MLFQEFNFDDLHDCERGEYYDFNYINIKVPNYINFEYYFKGQISINTITSNIIDIKIVFDTNIFMFVTIYKNTNAIIKLGY